MPLIDTPFKRVAVDLIVSEKGARYVLTLVDYATRYPEAVQLKTSAEAVAEALVDIYSLLSIHEEF